jgi:hypothetical protein
MSNNPSSKTVAVAFRLPIEVYKSINRKALKQGKSVSQRLKDRVIYDETRKHGN